MSPSLQALFLGTGSSVGVPMIGCGCSVCLSPDRRNKRTRSSILVTYAGKNILIDTSPDLRFQSLSYSISRIDAVVYTHAHADHVLGLDELRTFNFIMQEEIPIYAPPKALEKIMGMFSYAFSDVNKEGVTRPKLKPLSMPGPVEIFGLPIIPFAVQHGPVMNTALRIGNLVYLTDCNEVPEEARKVLHGASTMIVGAVRYEPHESHFGLEQAVSEIQRVQPKEGYITHLSHRLDHTILESQLPRGIFPAYDGLRISVD
ncbi:MAG: MBL fold metallo-hydrolase [Nitrospirota bacterium]|nr:MBL fold metallo-hydrolase [Nitrospirota bacterium]